MSFTLNLQFFNPVVRAINSFNMTDVFYSVEHEDGEPADSNGIITIVDMSDIYSRSKLADLIEAIREFEPAVLAVDIRFEGLKDDTIGSQRIAEALAIDDSVEMVVNFELNDYDKEARLYKTAKRSFFDYTDGALCTTPAIDSIMSGVSLRAGFSNAERDRYDGPIRNMSIRKNLNGEMVKSFPLTVAEAYGESCSSDIDVTFVDYTKTLFAHLTPDDIYEYSHLIKDHIVLLGATRDSTDMHATPLGVRSGVEVLAFSTRTLIEHSEIHAAKPWMNALITLIVLLVTQIYQYFYNGKVARLRNKTLRFLGTLSFFHTVAMFIWSGVLVCVGFLVFKFYGIEVNFVVLLAALVILNSVSNLYASLVREYYLRHPDSLARFSIYVNRAKSNERVINIDIPTLPNFVMRHFDR